MAHARFDKSVAAMHKALDAACESITQEAVDKCFADAPREVKAALPAARTQLVASLQSSITDEFMAILEESGLEAKLRRVDALCVEHAVPAGQDAGPQAEAEGGAMTPAETARAARMHVKAAELQRLRQLLEQVSHAQAALADQVAKQREEWRLTRVRDVQSSGAPGVDEEEAADDEH